MKALLISIIPMVVCVGLAWGKIPDPQQCIVLPCDNLGPPGIGGVVLCPGTPSATAASLVTVTVINPAGYPIPNAAITVRFRSANIAGCTAVPWTGVADDNGVWTHNFSGGGCLSGSNSCVIEANDVPIRAYTNVKSPDWNGGQANLAVQADDFSSFLTSFNPGTPGCHNYDNDGDTDLADFVIFASAFNPSHGCP